MVGAGNNLTNDELLVLLRDMRMEFPDMGETIVLGRLRAQGHSITKSRVRGQTTQGNVYRLAEAA